MIQALACPSNPFRPPAMSGGADSPEEALARAVMALDGSAVSAVLVALARAFRATSAVLVRGEGHEARRAVGLAGGDDAPEEDPSEDAGFIRDVLDAETPIWRTGPGAWRAGFRVALDGSVLGAVIITGPNCPSHEHVDLVCSGARPAAFLLAAAIGADGWRENARGPSRRVVSQGRLIAGGCPPADRAVLEYPLQGHPTTQPASELFAQFPEIVGTGPAVRGLLQSVWVAARSDIPVLIEGESGTGKELVACAIHRASRRAQSPFLCENCGALPENLTEAELFGHERGAFTGADRARPGLFERAAGGTVFLDEVSEMDLSLQRKLLRVLQEKEVRRLGAAETMPVDFRILAATNRILEDMVAAKAFREDLYYRLNVASISVPPLRERAEDIPILIDHFKDIFAGELGSDPLEIRADALRALTSYSWPGNVRELRNEIWKLACAGRPRVDSSCLSARILRQGRGRLGEPAPAGDRRHLEAVERDALVPAILEAIRCARGNRAEAARRLGITRAMLYRRLVRYGLGTGRPDEAAGAGAS